MSFGHQSQTIERIKALYRQIFQMQYFQHQMPDNQTVSHSQSLIRKIIFIF